MAAPITANADEHEGSPGHWRLVIILMAIYTYAFIDRVVLALLVEPIKRDLGATDVQISLMLGLAFAAFYGAFGLPAGHYVDRINRRRLIAFASVAWALMTIVCGTADTLSQLYLGRVGVGIAEAVITPAAFSLIRDAVPGRSRGLAFSIFAMAPMLGGAASLIGGAEVLRLAEGGAFAGLPLLGALQPWQCTLVIVGACGLPFSLLLLLVREPTRSTQSMMSAKSGQGLLDGLSGAFRYMIRRWTIYLPLTLFAVFGGMISFSKSAWLPTALGRRWDLLPQQVGPILGVLTLLGGVLGLLFAGAMMNHIVKRGGDIRRYGAIAAALSAVGIIGAMLAPSPNVGYAFVSLTMFFIGSAYAVGATTLADVTPIELMGRVSAVYLFFQNLLGQSLGPLMVALISTHAFSGRNALPNALTVSMIIFACAVAASAIALGRAVRRDRAVS